MISLRDWPAAPGTNQTLHRRDIELTPNSPDAAR